MSPDKRNLNAAMLYYIFDSANMHRWNDHFRTVDLTELDKQAHKAIIEWVLAKCEESAGNTIDWCKLIEHNLFAFIQRIAITDLKPPVYYKIMKDRKAEVNNYAYNEFCRLVPDMDPGFLQRFREFLISENESKEDDIVRAAHYLATRYEFDLIYDVNRYSYGIETTKKEVEEQVERFMGIGLAGMEHLKDRNDPLTHFINLVGQLRCQQRWARTPREPKTTVLGHCVFVANAVYLNDLDHGVSGLQIYNDFYSGLFHDLPEVLTKDVITPVKNSSDDLPELIGNIETDMFSEKVQPLIPEDWLEELKLMSLRPFDSIDGLQRDGAAIKACDLLGAWIEAYVSTQYGISSKILREAKVTIGRKLIDEKKGERIGVKKILEDFEKMEI